MRSETDLQDVFGAHLQKELSDLFNAKLLLAFSGGRDSVVLCDLLLSNGIKPELAHFNFQLRGKESDEDENFCRKFAQDHGLKIHIKHFDTEKKAADDSVSIQMAARDLRYDALEKIRVDNKLDLILTAHHLDDSIETFFINLFKGTGIRGLCGIPARNGNIVRPMLFIGRKEIDDFIAEKKILFREDSSNEKTDYLRNKIRIELIPTMLKVWPGLDKSFMKLFPNLQIARDMAETYARSHVHMISSQKNEDTHISIPLLLKTSHPEGILYEMLHPLGFNISQIKDILVNSGTNPGKIFNTPSHFLLIDREEFIVGKPQEENGHIYQIEDEEQDFYINHGLIEFKVLPTARGEALSSIQPLIHEPNLCCLDKDKLQFPLELRNWKNGDRFVPLGMKNEKKISDYLIDHKIPLNAKKEIRVLLSDNKIACIVGMQVSDIFRVDDTTRNVYLVHLKEL